MTRTEAKQYESQGWPHQHDWKFEREERYVTYLIKFYKCRCGKIKIVTPSNVEKIL